MGCIVSCSNFAVKRTTLRYSGELGWVTQWFTINIQLSHMSPRSRSHGHCGGHSQSKKTCRQYSVMLDGRVSRRDRWSGTPLSKQPITSLGVGAVLPGTSERRDGVNRYKKSQQAIELFCLECHHTPQIQQVEWCGNWIDDGGLFISVHFTFVLSSTFTPAKSGIKLPIYCTNCLIFLCIINLLLVI